MSAQNSNFTGGRSVPDVGVIRCRDDARPVGAECGGKYESVMSGQDRDFLGGRGVPDAGGLVL